MTMRTKWPNEPETICAACGMPTQSRAEYHPFIACQLFKSVRDSRTVRANLRAVVEYGMRAQAAGVSLDEAMRNIAAVPHLSESDNSDA